jgi:hypothetical protein
MYKMCRRWEKHNKIFGHKPDENKKLKLTWKDNIKVELNKMWVGADCIYIVQDNGQWQAVNSLQEHDHEYSGRI